MENLLNDYSNFGDVEILTEVVKHANEFNSPYYEGQYSNKVREIMKELCQGEPNVFFLTGGTLTNTLTISTILKSFEAVISASSGHIYVHENSGHKIITLPSPTGKLTATAIKNCMEEQKNSSTLRPKLVYISQPTETGTLYSKAELISIKKVCEENDLLLYMDGARLPIALVKNKQLSIKDYFELTDMFYFGGTKIGLPMGEMLIMKNKNYADEFKFFMKQYGAVLAKGEFISILFYNLLRNNKYIKFAEYSLKQSQKLVKFLTSKNIQFNYEPQTNQLFPILDNKIIEKLRENFMFSIWEKHDKCKSVIRLVTSYSTTDETINSFIDCFNSIYKK